MQNIQALLPLERASKRQKGGTKEGQTIIKVHVHIQRRPLKSDKIFKSYLNFLSCAKKIGDFAIFFGLLRIYMNL
jgi:hypothetical protein